MEHYAGIDMSLELSSGFAGAATAALVRAAKSLLRTILRAFAGLDRSNDATSEA
jgi:hypothetical protein